ncbi:DUF2079 domain-containing protein [bacterium]|nr:DUF2079 domain-containing protein [bacterium]
MIETGLGFQVDYDYDYDYEHEHEHEPITFVKGAYDRGIFLSMAILRRYRLELVLFACVFALMGAFKWRQYRSFGIHDYDTGIYGNVAWNIAHGNGFYSAINNRNQLGEHFSPIMAVFAPLYRVWPNPLNILLAQAVAVALAVVLFYEIAVLLSESLPGRERRWFVFTCTGMALFYLPLQSSLIFEFHPSTLGMPMVAGAVLCLHRKRTAAFWLLVAALLTTKEVALLSIAGLGFYAGFVLRRWRLMLALIAISALAAAVIFGLIMPEFRGPKEWRHGDRLDPFSLFGDKLQYLWRLGWHLGLTPFFSGAALIAAIPTTLLNVSVGMDNQFSILYHYDDQNCVFWIVAGMHGLARVYSRARGMAFFSRNAWRAPCALAVFVVGVSFAGGGVRFVDHWHINRIRKSREALQANLAKYVALPPEIGVATQTGFGPYLCHRSRFVEMEYNFIRYKYYKPGDYILLSDRVEDGGLDIKALIEAYRADPGLELVEKNKLLTVFRAR